MGLHFSWYSSDSSDTQFHMKIRDYRSVGVWCALIAGACAPPTTSLGDPMGEDNGDSETRAETTTGDPEGNSQSGPQSDSGTSGNLPPTQDSTGTDMPDSGEDSGTTAEECRGAAPDCAQCPDDCQQYEACVDGQWECGCMDCPPEEFVCDLDAVTLQATLDSKTPPEDIEDCGHLTFADSVRAWQEGQTCALQANAAEQTFRLVLDQPLDGLVALAVVGRQGEVYQRTSYSEDDGTGFGATAGVFLQDCTMLSATPGCTVAVGNVCLTCEGVGNPAEVCSG